ncbi:phosphatase PAP2 family protein [Salegentibacter chungangensis]|uniref:Phosphatase PAP2 family protein n=1 Tax=Salegentibacter chungangensis TaxID=1335724 RepID=A0ABW3NUD7_9FLAO
MKNILTPFFLLCISLSIYAQDNQSPYQTDLLKDGAWITAGVGLNVLGVLMIQNKSALSEAEANALNKNDLWKIDRWAAGNYSQNADEASYIPFYASFALPVAFLPSEEERNNFGQISVLFIETMATTGAMFTITAAAVEKSRPLVYNESLPMEKRTDPDAQRSFFAGHTAATAAATFFAAKVFNDFHPDSKAIPYVWAGAAAVPGLVGYLRLKAGKHFLTDNLIGFGIGAACGILIPEIHKKGNESINLYPTASFNINNTGLNSQGLAISYTF